MFIDIFTVGSDWVGTFDYMKDYCSVVYLERTKDISSTMLREQNKKIQKIGIIASGRIANRFVPESKLVSGVNTQAVYNPHRESAECFAGKWEIDAYDDLNAFLEDVDVVYIATPHETHYEYIRTSLEHGKHVLCEKPMVLEQKQAKELFAYAKEHQLILFEGIKTAREFSDKKYGGSFTELGSYCLLPAIKVFGSEYGDVRFDVVRDEEGLDIFTKASLTFPRGLVTVTCGLGVKAEGRLLIAGTKGYIVVEAPWWKTTYFEVHYENALQVEKYSERFLGDGLRYEIRDFLNMINGSNKSDFKLIFAHGA